MRILQVVHGFPPASTGGTETHTYLLAQELRQRHEVAVCAHLQDRTRREHSLHVDEHDGLPVFRMVNNFSWGAGPEYFFHDAAQDALFEEVLDRFGPDVVHLHHLGGGLSTSFPGVLRRRGVPFVLTLHDFWPLCYRSHLLTSDGLLCPGPDDGLRCACCWEQESRSASLAQRVRDVGLARALAMAPGYLMRQVGFRLGAQPTEYHTTRLLVRDQYFRRLLGRFDSLLAPSRFLLERYVEWGVEPTRIHLLPNGVSPAAFEGLERRLPLGDGLAAVYMGSLLPHKGLDVLLDAFDGLVGVPAGLRIYGRTTGSPALESYVRSLRRRLRNPCVTFEGPYAPGDLGRVLSAADVVIVPSILYENCPMTILEAFYGGRPVIASNVGGMAELVQDGVNGLTFQVGSADDLARAVRRIATEPEQLVRLQAGIVPPRTMEEVAREVEAHYLAVLAGTEGA